LFLYDWITRCRSDHPLALVRIELFVVARAFYACSAFNFRADFSVLNLMQGQRLKVLKVSDQSTSVESFVETLDNGPRALAYQP
jgi:hypothetical protein